MIYSHALQKGRDLREIAGLGPNFDELIMTNLLQRTD